MKAALAVLAIVFAAGCNSDPCSGVSSTCVALYVDRGANVAQLDNLQMHIVVAGTAYDKSAGSGRFALPAALAVVFDTFPDGVVDVDITALGTSTGSVVLQSDVAAQLTRGQHTSFHLTPSSSSSSSSDGGEDLGIAGGDDLAGSSACNSCPSKACFGGQCTKRVFVTSTLQPSNLGGLGGADTICQNLADGVGLGGTYRAWLSDSTGSPSTRFTPSTLPYVLVDGTPVADDWAGLTSGTLHHAISLTEQKSTPPATTATLLCCTSGTFVWSNTTAQGALYAAGASCGNWGGAGPGSAFGATDTATTWSFSCSGGDCGAMAPLYCVEQ